MPRNAPKDTEARINTVIEAWENLRPTKSFAGLTLKQAKEALQPSLDIRAEIAKLDDQMKAAIARRDAADDESLDTLKRIVNSVKADKDEGEDGELYGAMGYVRASARSSGLSRRKAAEAKA